MTKGGLLGRLAARSDILGIVLSDACAGRLIQYAEELLRWNRRTNLTGAKTVEDFIDGPLFDALTLLPVFVEGADAYIDVGSGAGLPGIPAMLVKAPRRTTLVEPRAKRAGFLRHAVHLLGLTAEVSECREDVLDDKWSDATAQAVFEPLEWVRRAKRLVAPGGHIYVLSSETLCVDMLPEGTRIDAQFECIRPAGHVPRFSYRVLVTM